MAYINKYVTLVGHILFCFVFEDHIREQVEGIQHWLNEYKERYYKEGAGGYEEKGKLMHQMLVLYLFSL